MRQAAIDRLIAILNNQPSEIDRVVKSANDEDTISITFKDGEVIVLTAETESGEPLEPELTGVMKGEAR
jgi:hypothetical protein